jgi:tRNA1Val (adenine37-N6)-methyltransferase
MKVCTDACLFGAYVTNELRKILVKNILDIGTGTGLLSLMLAQKITALIDAVEIDEAAFNQAKENIVQSPWQEKINIFNSDILKFKPSKKYDYIISNPPFFESDLKSNDERKNFARHDTSLTFTELLNNIDTHLSEEGLFAVLLPYHRGIYFEEESLKSNFYLLKKILVKQTSKHNFFRAMLIFSRTKSALITDEIIIKNENGNYSTEFIKLLKDYYLNL